MKNSIRILAAITAVIVSTSAAQAISEFAVWEDNQSFVANPIHLEAGTQNDVMTGVFDIMNLVVPTDFVFPVGAPGFRPGVDTVTDATLSVELFSRDPADTEIIRITLIDAPQFEGQIAWAGLFASQSVYGVSLDALAYVNQYGMIEFEIKAILGDFSVKTARLTAVGSRSVSVEDSGLTLTLSGMALLAVAGFRRRLGRRRAA